MGNVVARAWTLIYSGELKGQSKQPKTNQEPKNVKSIYPDREKQQSQSEQLSAAINAPTRRWVE